MFNVYIVHILKVHFAIICKSTEYILVNYNTIYTLVLKIMWAV